MSLPPASIGALTNIPVISRLKIALTKLLCTVYRKRLGRKFLSDGCFFYRLFL